MTKIIKVSRPCQGNLDPEGWEEGRNLQHLVSIKLVTNKNVFKN